MVTAKLSPTLQLRISLALPPLHIEDEGSGDTSIHLSSERNVGLVWGGLLSGCQARVKSVINAAQSAAKDLGYRNLKENQLEVVVCTNISFHVSKTVVEESLPKFLLLFALKVTSSPQLRQRISAHISDQFYNNYNARIYTKTISCHS